MNFQPGESPDDFDLDCRCGEKLELKDIETHKRFTDDMHPFKFTGFKSLSRKFQL